MTSGSVNTEEAGEDARLVNSIDLPSIPHLERGTTSRGKKSGRERVFPEAAERARELGQRAESGHTGKL